MAIEIYPALHLHDSDPTRVSPFPIDVAPVGATRPCRVVPTLYSLPSTFYFPLFTSNFYHYFLMHLLTLYSLPSTISYLLSTDIVYRYKLLHKLSVTINYLLSTSNFNNLLSNASTNYSCIVTDRRRRGENVSSIHLTFSTANEQLQLSTF